MSIILFILDTHPPDIVAGYNSFRDELARSLGYGVDADYWTAEQIAELDVAVNEAYRYILYPSKMPGGGPTHIWSWQRRVTTIATVASTSTYTLPADFDSMTSDEMTFSASTGRIPVRRTSAVEIRKRQQWTDYEGYPYWFAVQWAAQSGSYLQRQQIVFYPTPDSAYPISYEYAAVAPKLTVANPYPWGGPRISQLMIEATKAVGEAKKNGQRGDQWNIFREELFTAIEMDSATLTETTVGRLEGQYDGYDRLGRLSGEFGIRALTGSTYSGVV
jgi:hypothetical protein